MINTGWTGGAVGTGQRISLPDTRAIVDAVLGHQLDDASYSTDPRFGVEIPDAVPGVPSDLLHPESTWADKKAFAETANKLATMFNDNFTTYADGASDAIRAAAPKPL